MTPKQRKRAGTYKTFEKTFVPTSDPDGGILCSWDKVKDADEHYVWTIVDAEGRLYLIPGINFVNRIGYVLCAEPWDDAELSNPGFRY
jgi:hypothetical protein